MVDAANPLMRAWWLPRAGARERGMEEHRLGCTETPGMPYINKPSLPGRPSRLFKMLMETCTNYRQSNGALERKHCFEISWPPVIIF